MRISRRQLLEASGAAALGFFGLRHLVHGATDAAHDLSTNPYGELVPDPLEVLDLPPGFKYSIVSRRGDEMDDGLVVPDKPDGMATFAGRRGLTILIRNHENMPDNLGPFGRSNERLDRMAPDKLYDYGGGETPAAGGTTTVVYDVKLQQVVRQFLSLAGTMRNCAGGLTPWNTWITCEETVQRVGHDPDKGFVFEKNHGYNFEVPATLDPQLADPVPLKAMGRFNHEAVAVDPATKIIYQTEDRDDGLIYRFLPDVPGRPTAGGHLQALKIAGWPSADTRNWNGEESAIHVGHSFDVDWVDLDQVDAPEDDLRRRGFQAGAARFARGEGMWVGKDGIYFACTNGGWARKGQIWKYVPGRQERASGKTTAGGKLELFIEPNDSRLIENADNLTVAPWGDLIVCEDRSSEPARLVGVTPEGKLYTLASNHLKTELAGAVFSPDGSTLFVNLQHAGLTVAITGPW